MRFSARVPVPLADQLLRHAEQTKQTMNTLIVAALAAYLAAEQDTCVSPAV